MKKILTIVMASILTFVAPVGALADEWIYLYVEGEDQGHIKGSVNSGAELDTIAVTGWAMEFNAVLNSNGLPVRRQEHVPFEITKTVDISSVPLKQAFINKENLDIVELRIYRDNPDGTRPFSYAIKLEDATISKVRQFVTAESANSSELGTELIEIYYDTITWTYKATSDSVSDTW